jgi:hypothetical protein
MVSRKTIPFVIAALLAAQPIAAAPRDGSHDFDPEFGSWTIHIRRLVHPLAHANDWVTYEGTKLVTPIWGGKADIAEVTADGSAGHLQFIALRLYDPVAHQWSLNFASANAGTLGTPLVGEYRNGGIEFIGSDTFNGRNILVRFISHEDGGDHASSEQYFSDDGGHTWELNWVNDYTRTKGSS